MEADGSQVVNISQEARYLTGTRLMNLTQLPHGWNIVSGEFPASVYYHKSHRVDGSIPAISRCSYITRESVAPESLMPEQAFIMYGRINVFPFSLLHFNFSRTVKLQITIYSLADIITISQIKSLHCFKKYKKTKCI